MKGLRSDQSVKCLSDGIQREVSAETDSGEDLRQETIVTYYLIHNLTLTIFGLTLGKCKHFLQDESTWEANIHISWGLISSSPVSPHPSTLKCYEVSNTLCSIIV